MSAVFVLNKNGGAVVRQRVKIGRQPDAFDRAKLASHTR
jgi:hypothetical protein